MVRQKDIAKELNISRTTVARAFAGKNISEETRERVFEMAKKMGYVHNYAATTLSVKTMRKVYCFIIATIDEGYCRQMENGINRVTQVWNGYNLEFKIVFTDINLKGNQCQRQMEQFYEVVENEHVDGIIFSALSKRNLEYARKYCRSRDIPLMTLDLIYKDTELCHVGPSYFKLGMMSAAYLSEIMNRKGRVLTLYYNDKYELSKVRLEGFTKKLEEYPDIEHCCVQVKGIDCSSYKKALKKYIPQFHPTAIYALYKMDNVILALNQLNDTNSYRMISNGINTEIEKYLADGLITGVVSARPFRLGAIAAGNFCKYFYRGTELLRGEIDVGVNIYMRENYERYQDIF